MKAPRLHRYRLAYFGWSIEFSSAAKPSEQLRAEANRKLIEQHGTDPKPLGYVEAGMPFPAYVPVEMWDHETQKWWPLT